MTRIYAVDEGNGLEMTFDNFSQAFGIYEAVFECSAMAIPGAEQPNGLINGYIVANGKDCPAWSYYEA